MFKAFWDVESFHQLIYHHGSSRSKKNVDRSTPWSAPTCRRFGRRRLDAATKLESNNN
jgi:hypothetical protein